MFPVMLHNVRDGDILDLVERSLTNVGFHEASLMNFHEASLMNVTRISGASISLGLDGVHVGQDVREATLILDGLRSIDRDGVPLPDFVMECDDGEVLTCEATPDGLRLQVEWNDFAAHRHFTTCYRFTCRNVRLADPKSP